MLRWPGFRVAVVSVIAAILLLSIRCIRADDGKQTSIRSKVGTLLEQLDSSKLAERTLAERNLLELGPEVLTFLPPPELTPSASVRQSVTRVRILLERQAARESAQASLVRVFGDFAVAELLNEITKQTRNRVELSNAARQLSSHSVHVEFDSLPFWECLDELCDRLELAPVFNPLRSTLSLELRSKSEPLKTQSSFSTVQRTGPVRIAVQSAEVRPIVGNERNQLLRITARITLEPRLRPLFLHFKAIDLQATDAMRHRLDVWNPAATYEQPVGDAGRDVSIQLDYLLPFDSASATVDVNGRVWIQLAAGTERIVFDQTSLTPGTSRRRGGVTVRLRETKFEPEESGALNAIIGVAVTYDTGGPAFESHRTWMFHNAVYLEESSHRRFDFTDYETSQQSDGSIAVDYHWKKLASPASNYQFVYEAPTLILDLPVDFKLEKIPINRTKDSSIPNIPN